MELSNKEIEMVGFSDNLYKNWNLEDALVGPGAFPW